MESIALVNTLLLLGALLVIAGILSSLLAFRFGGPLLLVFLGIGMLAGEDGPGGLPFDDYRLTYLIGSGALAVILFDGGLRTRLSTFRGALGPAVTLATIGVVATAALVSLAAKLLLGLGWLESLLIGAVIASTDAAAVFFLLRTGGLQLRRRVGATLEMESATNDPAAVFLTVIIIEVLLAGRGDPGWTVLVSLLQQAGVGGAFGIGGGLVLAWILNRVELAGGLHPLFAVAGAILIFAAAALLGGSGFLAAYVAGLVLGNRPLRALGSITSFHDTLTWLCQIVMFIVLGLLVTPSRMLPYAVPALGIALFLILIARPLAVWLCLLPFRFRLRETLFVSWVGLRGAVSIFLSAIPVLVGLPSAELYFNVAFFVVLVSLLVQGWTIVPAARRLGMALPNTGPPPHRIELDLPGQLEFEMVGYHVFPDSPILKRGPFPRWARPILVVRAKAILQPAEAGALQPDDYAYFLAPPERAARLDRLFGHATEDAEEPQGFPIPGAARMGDLGRLYGVDLSEEEADLTVAQLFAHRFDDGPQPGDRVAFGSEAVLAVLDLDDDGVSRATLLLASEPAPAKPAALPGKSLWSRLRRRRTDAAA